MAFCKDSYFKPTPKNLRKLGDSLLAVTTMVSVSSIANGNDTLAIVLLVVGVIGKFLTNFFSE